MKLDLGQPVRTRRRVSIFESLWGRLGDSRFEGLQDILGGDLRFSLWGSLWDTVRVSLRGGLQDNLKERG